MLLNVTPFTYSAVWPSLSFLPIPPSVRNLPLCHDMAGMRITDVAPGSPAAEAGFQVGYILVSLNDAPIYNAETAWTVARDFSGIAIPAVVRDVDTELILTITPRNDLLGVTLCDLDRCP